MDDLVLAPFKDILKDENFLDLLSFGLRHPPMTLVSYYYRLLGVSVLQLVKTIKKNGPIFFPSHEVI